MLKCKHLLALLLAFTAVAALAAPVGERYYFRNFDSRNGLSQNSVSSILQDRRGFIWVGTNDGLNRFDGTHFRRISRGRPDKISYVSCLYEAPDGRIWIGNNNGLSIYNPQDESVVEFDAATAKGVKINRPVMCLCADGKGGIFMVSENQGVFHYSHDGKLRMMESAHPVGTIVSMLHTAKGRLWIGSFDRGLFYSDDKLRSLHPYRDASGAEPLRGSMINAMHIHGDKLYLGTAKHGLQSVDLRTGVLETVVMHDAKGTVPFIRDLIFLGNQIWLGCENGIYIYDQTSRQLTQHLRHNSHDKYSLADNAVYRIMADRQGNLWIGTYFGGLDFLDRKSMQFDKYYDDNTSTGLRGQRVRELLPDGRGHIFVGTEDAGLSVFDSATGSFSKVDGIRGHNIHGLCLDGDELWVGTFAEGLSIKNLRTGGVRHLMSGQQGLGSDYVFTICRTAHGEMYIGTFAGIQRYNAATQYFENAPGFPAIFVYHLYEDSNGNMWAATYDKGLWLRRSGDSQWTHFTSADGRGLPADKVYSVQEDSRHRIWVLTQAGACVYDASKQAFDTRYMGVDNIQGVVYRIVEDKAGYYWLSTNTGLYRIAPRTGTHRRFTTHDGLPTNQFNFCSSLSTPDGHIWMGTIDGLVRLNPYSFSENEAANGPVFTELYLDGKPVRPYEANSPLECSLLMTDRLHLAQEQSTFSIKISSLNYASPEGQHLRFRLDGYDSDWNTSTMATPFVTYSKLPSGTYTLRVALCDSSGEMIGQESTLEITVATPWYRTGLALLFFFLLAVGVLLLAFRHYRRYQQLNNQRYLERYTRQKERESYDEKIKFFTNVAHEIRTPLALIKAPLDHVMHKSVIAENADVRENLDVVNMNVDRLLMLANQLLDFRRIEDGKHILRPEVTDIRELIKNVATRFKPTFAAQNKHLEIVLPEAPVKAYLDVEALTKIVSNLLTNAIKYSDSYARLTLTANDKVFEISVANDGELVPAEQREAVFSLFTRLQRVEPQPGTGIGMAYSRSLASMLGGQLSMAPSETENVFVLSVPIGEKPETKDEESTVSDLEQLVADPDSAPTVLLVEDNAEMLSFLEKRLIAHHYTVLKAGDGLQALDILQAQYVDIVVSDVMMPHMDGMELLQRIKSDISFSHIPVVLLTAKTQMEDKLAGLESGADSYIEKPFAVEYLLATLGGILRNRDRLRQRLESLPLAKVSGKNGLSKVDEDFLRRINEIIQANFHDPAFSMEDVISAVGMSRTSFYRKIKGLLDLNPGDYIRIERLKRAATLFGQGHSSVSEVCYMVGFSSPSYFTKCFQKQFGLSPKDYIASMEKK